MDDYTHKWASQHRLKLEWVTEATVEIDRHPLHEDHSPISGVGITGKD
jgi:hypothetical protein